MSNSIYREELTKIVADIVANVNPLRWQYNSNYIKPYLQSIIDATPFLDTKCKLSLRFWCILENICYIPICTICKMNLCRIIKRNDPFYKNKGISGPMQYSMSCCSRKCSAKHAFNHYTIEMQHNFMQIGQDAAAKWKEDNHAELTNNNTIRSKKAVAIRLAIKKETPELYKQMCKEISERTVNSKIKNGSITNPTNYSAFIKYKRKVWEYTNDNYKQNLSQINPHNLPRTRRDMNKNAHHLDHKFSIFEGFNQGIPEEIIGNSANLQMLSHSQNCSKNIKCSISYQELLDLCAK